MRKAVSSTLLTYAVVMVTQSETVVKLGYLPSLK